MIKRASIKRPWIFKQIDEKLTTALKIKEPSLLKICDIMDYHMKKIVECEGEREGFKKIRAQAMRYFNGFKFAKKVRKMSAVISSFEDFNLDYKLDFRKF